MEGRRWLFRDGPCPSPPTACADRLLATGALQLLYRASPSPNGVGLALLLRGGLIRTETMLLAGLVRRPSRPRNLPSSGWWGGQAVYAEPQVTTNSGAAARIPANAVRCRRSRSPAPSASPP